MVRSSVIPTFYWVTLLSTAFVISAAAYFSLATHLTLSYTLNPIQRFVRNPQSLSDPIPSAWDTMKDVRRIPNLFRDESVLFSQVKRYFSSSRSLSDLNSQGIEPEPEVEGRISNVTFPAGREAVLTCSVRNLGRYKVNITFLRILCCCPQSWPRMLVVDWGCERPIAGNISIEFL